MKELALDFCKTFDKVQNTLLGTCAGTAKEGGS